MAVIRFTAMTAGALVFTLSGPVRGQTVEITPFGGYRAGSTFSSIATGQTVGDDSRPSVGLLVNVEFGDRLDGLKIEALYSHHRMDVESRPSLLDPPIHVPVEVDYLQIGGIQELDGGRMRPFLSGLVGLTRFASPETVVRFSIGAGGGAKFYATPNLGLRLDGRVYLTIVEANFAAACGGGCIVQFAASPIWEADFTAGVIFAF